MGVAGLSATAACTIIGLAPYPAAAVMGATGVAAVGVNRSMTGDCWGSCYAPQVCERDSGLCVRRPCDGECRIDEMCENERCVLRRREQSASANDGDGGTTPEHDDSGESR